MVNNRYSVPAICENPQCGKVFFATAFAFSGPGAGTLKDISIGSCPDCGAYGLIPSGRYGASVTDIFDPEKERIVIAALGVLQGMASRDEVVAKIDRDFSFLVALKPLLPRDRGEVIGYLGIIIGALALNSQPQEIRLDDKSIEALHSVSKALEKVEEIQRKQSYQPPEIKNED